MRRSSTSSSIGCPRNSYSSVSFCAHGCGVRPTGGNSRTRIPFGRPREPRSAVTQEFRELRGQCRERGQGGAAGVARSRGERLDFGGWIGPRRRVFTSQRGREGNSGRGGGRRGPVFA